MWTITNPWAFVPTRCTLHAISSSNQGWRRLVASVLYQAHSGHLVSHREDSIDAHGGQDKGEIRAIDAGAGEQLPPHSDIDYRVDILLLENRALMCYNRDKSTLGESTCPFAPLLPNCCPRAGRLLPSQLAKVAD